MAVKYLVISDFSGGEATRADGMYAPNESRLVRGFTCRTGSLKVPLGRLEYTATAPKVSTGQGLGVTSLFRHYKTGHPVNNTTTTSATKWTIAKIGPHLMLDMSVVRDNGAVTGTTGNDWRPIDTRTSQVRESFVPHINGQLYYSNATDGMHRWAGNFYKVGKIKCAGTGPYARGTTTNWNTGLSKNSVRYGDKLYVRGGNAVSSTWGTTGYRVKRFSGATGIYFMSTGPNTSGTFVDYIITRTHSVGVGTGPTPSAVAAAGTGMAAGNYVYVCVPKDSQTSYSGNQSPSTSNLGLTTSGTMSANVTVTSTAPNVDQAMVYRTDVNYTAGAAVYYYGTTINRSTTTGTFPVWHDQLHDTTGASPTLGALLTEPEHERPHKFSEIRDWNGHIVGWGANAGQLEQSTVNSPEYWPQYIFGVDFPTDFSFGGVFYLGHYGDDVVDAVGEGGSYAQSGNQGGSLLVFTKSKGVRIVGSDWFDWQIVPAFNEGLWAAKSAVNCGGLIFGVGQKGLIAVQSGSSEVQHLYEKMGSIFRPSTYASSGVDLTTCQAVYNDGYYVLMTTPGSFVSWDVARGVYTETFESQNGFYWDCRSIGTADGPGDTGKLLLGHRVRPRLYVADSATRYASATTDPYYTDYSYTEYLSPWLSLADRPEDLYKIKTLERVMFVFKLPNVYFDRITQVEEAPLLQHVSVYTDGYGNTWSAAAKDFADQPLVSLARADTVSQTNHYHKIAVYPNQAGRVFSISFQSLELPTECELVYIMLTYHVEGEMLDVQI